MPPGVGTSRKTVTDSCGRPRRSRVSISSVLLASRPGSPCLASGRSFRLRAGSNSWRRSWGLPARRPAFRLRPSAYRRLATAGALGRAPRGAAHRNDLRGHAPVDPLPARLALPTANPAGRAVAPITDPLPAAASRIDRQENGTNATSDRRAARRGRRAQRSRPRAAVPIRSCSSWAAQLSASSLATAAQLRRPVVANGASPGSRSSRGRCSSARASIGGSMQKSSFVSPMWIPPFPPRREPRPIDQATCNARIGRSAVDLGAR